MTLVRKLPGPLWSISKDTTKLRNKKQDPKSQVTSDHTSEQVLLPRRAQFVQRLKQDKQNCIYIAFSPNDLLQNWDMRLKSFKN